MPVFPPTGVYRFYDQENALLYVGVTDSMGTRWRDHMRRDWWPQVARYTIAWHGNRVRALHEEARAIATESPRHNLSGPIPDPDLDAFTEEEWEALPTAPRYQPKRGPRRPKGEGSLFQRSADGLWLAAITDGWTTDGRRRRRTFSAKTPELALAKMEAFRKGQT